MTDEHPRGWSLEWSPPPETESLTTRIDLPFSVGDVVTFTSRAGSGLAIIDGAWRVEDVQDDGTVMMVRA